MGERQDPAERARGADRDLARDLLDQAYVDGRVDDADWQLRRERVDAAGTLGELMDLLRDVVDVATPTDDVEFWTDRGGGLHHTGMPGHYLPGDTPEVGAPPAVDPELFSHPVDPGAVQPTYRSRFMRPVAWIGWALIALMVAFAIGMAIAAMR